mgnify:CR=1 FL=1
MRWRLALGWVLVPIAIGSALPAAAPARAGRDRLNILLVISDDLNTDLGCYGHPVVRSPHVDRLARRGLRFTRAYCQYPVCNPSRTSFLTGLRPDRTGILDNRTPYRTRLPEAMTLPRLFRRNGYVTAALGKVFHDGAEFNDPEGWDLIRTPTGTPRGRQGEGRSLAPYPWCRWVAAEGDDSDQPDGQIADEAIRFLAQPRDRPFFLAVGFHRPHDPFINPRRYLELYPLDRLRPPVDPPDRSPEVPGAIPTSYRFDFTDQDRREFMRAYYAGISMMDAQLGRLLAALEQQRLADRTLVIFIGDHGYHVGERGWWNKNTLFERSARVPMIVAGPGVPRGRTCDRLVELVDLYATLSDLCRLPPPPDGEGISLRPLLRDPARPWKSAAFTQVQRGRIAGRSLRTERWRYTEWGEEGPVELYDHATDPGEYRNLATDPAHAAIRAQLRERLRAGWRAALPPGG